MFSGMRYVVQFYRDSRDPIPRLTPSYRAYIMSQPPLRQSDLLEHALDDLNTLKHDIFVKHYGHDRYFRPENMMDILRDIPYNPSTHRQQYFH